MQANASLACPNLSGKGARSRSRANSSNPSLPLVIVSKGHCPLEPIYFRRCTRFRVSDEGGFWASMAVRPRAARKPRERQKPTEVGDADEHPNHDKT